MSYYVYSADNKHVGPISAELIAREVLAGKVPNDAFIAPIGSNSWTPMGQFPEVATALTQAKTASTPPPPPVAAAAAPEKKEEKKPVLDPRFKLLPLGIFAVFAFAGIVETAVVMILR
jgi:hypothetical protein